MSEQDLNLALVQFDVQWHDPAANRAHLETLLGQVEDADLVVLPEMFSTGFSMEPEAIAEPEQGPTYHWLLAQAKRLNAVVTGSLVVQATDGTYRNRLYWAQPDGHAPYYDKRHLFRMAGEHEHYHAGDEQLTVELKGWKIRPLICYDLRFPVWSRDPHDTDLLFYIASWPAARRLHWNRLLPARAIENLCYVAGVNRIGVDGKGYQYSGDTQLLDFHGEALIPPTDYNGVQQIRLSKEALQAYRKRFPAYQDADRFSLLD